MINVEKNISPNFDKEISCNNSPCLIHSPCLVPQNRFYDTNSTRMEHFKQIMMEAVRFMSGFDITNSESLHFRQVHDFYSVEISTNQSTRRQEVGRWSNGCDARLKGFKVS